MSERAGKMLEEEMEFFSAPRVAEIENAQRAVVDAALRLEKEGVILLEDVAVALA
jgi:flagellar motor switch protein FliG